MNNFAKIAIVVLSVAIIYFLVSYYIATRSKGDFKAAEEEIFGSQAAQSETQIPEQ